MIGDHKLPDVLHVGMDLVFVGTAAGKRSASVGEYYAYRGNRFWNALADVGLTKRIYSSSEFRDMAQLGIGFTDIVKSAAGMDHHAEVAEALRAAPAEFVDKMKLFKPKAIAFTSKRAASVFLSRRTGLISYGKLRPSIPDFPEIFVLPSSSDAARLYWTIEPWRDVADWHAAQGCRS